MSDREGHLGLPTRDVQWLVLCASNAGSPGSIPGQGTRSHMPQPGTAKLKSTATEDHLEKSCECCWSPNQPHGEHSRAAPAMTSPCSLTPQSCSPPNRKPEASGPHRSPSQDGQGALERQTEASQEVTEYQQGVDSRHDTLTGGRRRPHEGQSSGQRLWGDGPTQTLEPGVLYSPVMQVNPGYPFNQGRKP